jgi:hypothetical protein
LPLYSLFLDTHFSRLSFPSAGGIGLFAATVIRRRACWNLAAGYYYLKCCSDQHPHLSRLFIVNPSMMSV